jgi:hypothetical protein
VHADVVAEIENANQPMETDEGTSNTAPAAGDDATKVATETEASESAEVTPVGEGQAGEDAEAEGPAPTDE